MKKITPFLLLSLLFSACKQNQPPNSVCPLVYSCPAIFPGGILVTYVDKTNTAIAVAGFHVIDLRTNQPVTTHGTILLSPGTYSVADYSDKKLFSTTGDSLQVTATDTLTSQTKTVGFKIAGGICACDISKISGPDTVKFN